MINEYTDDQLKIIKSMNPDEEIYSLLDEKQGNLYYDEARELIETGYGDVLYGLDEQLKKIVFDTAMSESGAYEREEGDEPWLAVFNEYRDYANIIKLVRLSHEGQYDLNHKTESAKIMSESSNLLNQAFSLFRSKPSMPPEEAKEIMEAAFPLVSQKISEDARQAVFNHGYERYSADGYSEVLEDFSDSISIIHFIIPNPDDYEEITTALKTRVERETAIKTFKNMKDEELFDVITNGETELERYYAKDEAEDRGYLDGVDFEFMKI